MIEQPMLFGPCAKRRVQAVLTAADGSVFVGENVCMNPQPVCPRLPGEGYQKCKTICQQVGHAELLAMAAAGPRSFDAKLVVTHTHACKGCSYAIEQFGITAEFVGAPDA